MKDWILYEDNHIIIVNKPPKIPVQGDKTGDITLLDIGKNYIKKEYNKPGNVYLGLPHRIDRPTSGIVILSKTSKSLSRMTALFRNQEITKQYWAVVKNKLKAENGTLINFLKKNKTINKSFVSKNEKKGFLKAVLNYQLHCVLDNYFMYKIILLTGRHHQIRVQLANAGSPIKGDIKYGFNRTNKNGSIHLHARKIEFTHPIKKEKITIIAPPPKNDSLWVSCIKQ
tara:strand:- start:3224 stop:3904 length:681 start_codon:yes stop_codon:yes gene_type:complete